ncbi:MAG: hypothetical protein E6Q76_12790 [Rhizobium sp.]|nr:MAG: hypothetical protein E6Q76_12790 [Rhizobium sp.]
MSLISDLVTVLNSFSTVTDLCVTNAKTGTKAIRPDHLSQTDVLNATHGGIEISTISTEFLSANDGSSKTGIYQLTISSIARGSVVANALADAIWDALEPFTGATEGGRIESVVMNDRREEWATLDDGTDTGEYVVEQDLSVFYRRS